MFIERLWVGLASLRDTFKAQQRWRRLRNGLFSAHRIFSCFSNKNRSHPCYCSMPWLPHSSSMVYGRQPCWPISVNMNKSRCPFLWLVLAPFNYTQKQLERKHIFHPNDGVWFLARLYIFIYVGWLASLHILKWQPHLFSLYCPWEQQQKTHWIYLTFNCYVVLFPN